jgi:hypothetical protein
MDAQRKLVDQALASGQLCGDSLGTQGISWRSTDVHMWAGSCVDSVRRQLPAYQSRWVLWGSVAAVNHISSVS